MTPLVFPEQWGPAKRRGEGKEGGALLMNGQRGN
jgi:hypothetical protein